LTQASPTQIAETVRRVVRRGNDAVPLHAPNFSGHEWDYVKDCIDTGWVSTAGSYVPEFEARIAAACGVRHAVAVVNGTAALHMALMVCGVKRGDEVIVPALTFAATANAVVHAGATPHFADSERTSLGIDAARLDRHLGETCDPGPEGPVNRLTGKRIAAIIPMHVFGHPVDLDALADVAGRHRIAVVEDAAEALGSTYRGRPAGSLGRIAALSFNGNKIITTGGGGAITTDDEDLARRARHLATTAKLPHRWAFEHDEVGYNYRMPNLNAALGCAQIEKLSGFVDAKRRLATSYFEAFDGLAGVTVLREPGYARSNYWLNALVLDDPAQRDLVLAATNDAGLMTRPVWTLMHRLGMYRDCPRMDLSVCEDLEGRLVNIPSSAELADGGL
jgi:perosamine synthetase